MRRLLFAAAIFLGLVTGAVTAAAQSDRPSPGLWYIQATVTPPSSPAEASYYPSYYSSKVDCEKAMHFDTTLDELYKFVVAETKEHGVGTIFAFTCKQIPGSPGQPISYTPLPPKPPKAPPKPAVPDMQVPDTTDPGDLRAV